METYIDRFDKIHPWSCVEPDDDTHFTTDGAIVDMLILSLGDAINSMTPGQIKHIPEHSSMVYCSHYSHDGIKVYQQRSTQKPSETCVIIRYWRRQCKDAIITYERFINHTEYKKGLDILQSIK